MESKLNITEEIILEILRGRQGQKMESILERPGFLAPSNQEIKQIGGTIQLMNDRAEMSTSNLAPHSVLVTIMQSAFHRT